MTSPDFMYPQPTDDELAAQQPWASAPRRTHSGQMASSGPVVGPQPAPAPDSTAAHMPAPHGEASLRLGRIAAALAITAAALSLIASVILGITIGPMEVEYGYYFTDLPSWFQTVATGLAGLHVLCTLLGVTALIMGIVAIATGRGRSQGIVASVVAVLAPFVSFGAFVILSYAIG